MSKEYNVVFTGSFDNTTANKMLEIIISVDGVEDIKSERAFGIKTANNKFSISTNLMTGLLATGKVIKVRFKTEGGTFTFYNRCLTIYGVS